MSNIITSVPAEVVGFAKALIDANCRICDSRDIPAFEKMLEVLFYRLKGITPKDFSLSVTFSKGFNVAINGCDWNLEDNMDFCTRYIPTFSELSESVFGTVLSDGAGLLEDIQAGSVYYAVDYLENALGRENATPEEFRNIMPMSDGMCRVFSDLLNEYYTSFIEYGADSIAEQCSDFLCFESKPMGEFVEFLQREDCPLAETDREEAKKYLSFAYSPFDSGGYEYTAVDAGVLYCWEIMGFDGYQDVSLSNLDMSWYPACIVTRDLIERYDAMYGFMSDAAKAVLFPADKAEEKEVELCAA